MADLIDRDTQPTQADTLNALETLDCISRKAALDLLSKDLFGGNAERIIANMPSAQPQRMRGRWEEKEVMYEDEARTAIYEWQSARCSVCGKYHTTPYMYYFDGFNYCPNCGADMRGEQDDLSD